MQVADSKADEILSAYDYSEYPQAIEELQEEYNSVCHTLNQFLSTLQSTAA